jgi:hypothetical protein
MPRLPNAASILLLLISQIARADEPAKPIPQDAAQIAKDRQASAAWKLRTLGEAYDKVGNKDPKWDKHAREALAAFILPFLDTEKVFVPAKRAIDAGCDDPLILYLYARTSFNKNFPGPEEVERRYTIAARALKKSSYPAFRKASALVRVGIARSTAKNLSQDAKQEALQMLDESVALLPSSLSEEASNHELDDTWFLTLNEIVASYRRLGLGKEDSLARVERRLSGDRRTEMAWLHLKGHMLLVDGWEARGIGLAGTITQEGGRVFSEKLTEARKVLEKAWETSPGDYRSATIMLTVLKGIGGGDRAELERWFERAMATNGDNREACYCKLDWLDPKWYGDQESLLAFGRACRDTKNVNSRIPLLLADTHYRASNHMDKDARRKYLTNPDVWKDIRSVYEPYLKLFPTDSVQRARYAAHLTMCLHITEAKEQFDIVGDDLFGSDDFSLNWLKQLRDYVKKQTD